MVKLYAKRLKLKGYKFSKDTPWQREFEDSFIYEETSSQLRVIDEIKKDMQSDNPMDRLLCGDVGYGKTEVALRAAFKAIMDGKQVAFLVPTTILANQHYETALERMKDFPVKIEMLSRFRTKAQQNAILENTRKGYVDLLIGTHRILSSDIKFKDLGLLIVDEEQRFGVRAKEKLKILRENIDVLMLSATPIPRTLQMGLVGIRDMSLLDERPVNRFPTATYVLEYEPGIIREAIIREMERDGQIYFVYNKVLDIDRVSLELSNLVPEARIAIGHGKMTPRALEKVMKDFNDYKYDILLSTSIIETGLDIKNANTMIIYGANRMGLSQIYQLKGRIGRSDRTSFCYVTYEKNISLTEIAEKRLKAIKDFQDLGSGYKIAMKDLELRGAGNMLGESQSGHIDQIGYDLYVKFLEEALKKVKGEKITSQNSDITIDLKLDSYISSSYIKDLDSKIEIYKRISEVETYDELLDLNDELLDRFGEIPVPTQNVIKTALIKNIAKDFSFKRVYNDGKYINFFYEDMNAFSLEKFSSLREKYRENIEFSMSSPFSIKILIVSGAFEDSLNFLEYLKKLEKHLKNA